MNFRELISSREKLFESARYCLTHNKSYYFFENLKQLYRWKKILSEKSFYNLVALDEELGDFLKWYDKIVIQTDYENYRENKLKYIDFENKRKEESKKEKKKEKEIQQQRAEKLQQNLFKLREEKQINPEIKKQKLEKRKKIRWIKVDFYKNHRNLLSFILKGKELPLFEWMQIPDIIEMLNRIEFTSELTSEQYTRYKRIFLLYSEESVVELWTLNKQIKERNQNLKKPFSPQTHIIYHKNWR